MMQKTFYEPVFSGFLTIFNLFHAARPELFETDAADKYFISARINHRGQRNFPLALLLNTASVKTLLRNSIFVRYLKYPSAHDTHPPEVQAVAGDTGCADAPVQLFWLLSRHPARAFAQAQLVRGQLFVAEHAVGMTEDCAVFRAECENCSSSSVQTCR